MYVPSFWQGSTGVWVKYPGIGQAGGEYFLIIIALLPKNEENDNNFVTSSCGDDLRIIVQDP